MNSYPQAQDGGNKFVEGLATGGLLAGLGYFSLNPQRRAEARQKIANLVNPDAKSATAGVRQGDLGEKTKTKAPTKTERSNLGVAQATRVKKEVPVEQVPASPPGALVKPSSSPSDLLARTVDEVSVKILDDPQPQIPGGSLGQGILTSYPTTSQRKAAYDAAAAKPVSELPAVTRPSSGVDVELITDPVTGEKFAPGRSPAGTTPRDYLEDQGFVANTMVDQQDARVGLQVDQSVAAINAAEDQATGRVMRRLQANEDLDIGAVNAAKEQAEAVLEDTISRNPQLASDTPLDAAANSVARNLPDGAPIDQAETGALLGQSSAARFLASERDEIASQLGEQGLTITPGRIESELANRLGADAYLYGPKYTQRKQALQLGATYDPALFENMAKSSVRVAGEEVPTGRVSGIEVERTPYTNTLIAEDVELGLRQPTYMQETSERLQERAANKRDWLGSVRLEEASKNAKLNAELININRQYNETLEYSKELTDFLDSKQGTPEQRTRARQRLDDVNYELNRLDTASESLHVDIYERGQSAARVRGAEKFTEDYIENLTPPPRLKPGIEEGQRLFFEVDEFTGEPIPDTQELRPERKMVDMTPKGGGGRNVAEFSAGTRDEGVEIDLEGILQEARTPRGQSAREYTKDQFGYRPGTGLTGKALEGQPFTDDRTQTGRVIKRTGIQKSGPQPGSIKAVVNPYTQLDNETLGMISLQGSEADALNAARILARRRREGYDPSTITGPGQSQQVVSSVSLTPEQKQTKIKSIDASRQIAALQRSGRPDAQQQVQRYIQQLRGGI